MKPLPPEVYEKLNSQQQYPSYGGYQSQSPPYDGGFKTKSHDPALYKTALCKNFTYNGKFYCCSQFH